MPWTAEEFKSKHAHDLTDAQAKKAASIANAMLNNGSEDGVAIATGIKRAKEKASSDTITMDTELFIRLMEFCRENAGDDLVLHKITERCVDRMGEKSMLTVDDYHDLVPEDHEQEDSVKEEASTVEIAFSPTWWDRQSDERKQDYIKRHPGSRYAFHHTLTSNGWEQRGKNTYFHPKSKRRFTFKTPKTHEHHIAITHPKGDVSEHHTNAHEYVHKLARRMAVAPGAGIAKALSKDKGSLHKATQTDPSKPIPLSKLEKLAKSDHALARRAQMVLNLKRARARAKVGAK